MTGWTNQLTSLWEVKPKIARMFPFDEIAAAQRFIQDHKNIANVLLTP